MQTQQRSPHHFHNHLSSFSHHRHSQPSQVPPRGLATAFEERSSPSASSSNTPRDGRMRAASGALPHESSVTPSQPRRRMSTHQQQHQGSPYDANTARLIAGLPLQNATRRPTNADGDEQGHGQVSDGGQALGSSGHGRSISASQNLVNNPFGIRLDGSDNLPVQPNSTLTSPVDARVGPFNSARTSVPSSLAPSALPVSSAPMHHHGTGLSLLSPFMGSDTSGPMSAPAVAAPDNLPWSSTTSQPLPTHSIPIMPSSTTLAPAATTTPASHAALQQDGSLTTSAPFTFGERAAESPLLTLSKLGSGAEQQKPKEISPTQRRRVSGATRQRPHLSTIDTATASSSSQQQQQQRTPVDGASGGVDRPHSEPEAIAQIGRLLDEVVNLASNARDLFQQGDHGPSSMCLGKLSRSLNQIGALGSQSLAQIQQQQQQQQQQKTSPQSTLQQQHLQHGEGRNAESTHQRSGSDNANAASVPLPLESPGIRKRAINPLEEIANKTMRGQFGAPIEPPAPPPSAPPAVKSEMHGGPGVNGLGSQPRHDLPPSRPAAPALQHTSSAPLVPQLKNFGPSPLGSGPAIQSQGWHDPGAGSAPATRSPSSMATAFSPIVDKAASSFAVVQPAQSLPTSPHASLAHSRTRSLLDDAFPAQPRSVQASPLITQHNDDDEAQWPQENGDASPDGGWSPSHDFDDPYSALERSYEAHVGPGVEPTKSHDGDAPQQAQGHGMSLKGTIGAPDMPGRGPILPLPTEVQERLDSLFYRYLRFVCSNNDCSDANGEGIHQTLMPKRMSRLNHSEDFRPFKFRIQAFVNRWQEEVYKSGMTEEQCSPKRLRQYLWTQPYISRFNEDGRKAKSKGNHVWIVEGRKLSDDEWEFQRFERKIVGPQDKVAYFNLPWTWTLRVWDPQMSASSIKPTFTVLSKPAWLDYTDGDEAGEKVLSGTPSEHTTGGLVSVSAQCLLSNGTLQTLDISFDLPVAPAGADVKATAPAMSVSSSSTSTLQPPVNMQSHLGAMLPPTSTMPLSMQHAQQNQQSQHQSSQHQQPVAGPMGASTGPMSAPISLTHSHQPSGMAFGHQPVSNQAHAPGVQDASQFFASMNYPFTPPDAFTSQPPPFFTDGNGDSPMPMLAPNASSMNSFSSLAALSQPQAPQGVDFPQQSQIPMAQGASQPFGIQPSSSVSSSQQATPVPTPSQAMEPHNQVQRAQVRAVIERMQRDQTANISLKLPERRKSQADGLLGGDEENDALPLPPPLPQQQQQQQQTPRDQQAPSRGNMPVEQLQRIQQAHVQLQQQQQAQAEAQALQMPPPGQPLSLEMVVQHSQQQHQQQQQQFAQQQSGGHPNSGQQAAPSMGMPASMGGSDAPPMSSATFQHAFAAAAAAAASGGGGGGGAADGSAGPLPRGAQGSLEMDPFAEMANFEMNQQQLQQQQQQRQQQQYQPQRQ